MLAFDAMNAFLDAESASSCTAIVHGEQRFAYERPVVVGDVLTATLTVASLRQIGGTDIIGTTSEITDADGALVCTDHAPPSCTGGRVSAMTPATLDRRPTPSPAPTWSRYAGASGDLNPIHQDDRGRPQRRAARRDRARHVHDGAGRPRASRALDPGAEVVELGCKFTKPGRRTRRRAASRSRSPAPSRRRRRPDHGRARR